MIFRCDRCGELSLKHACCGKAGTPVDLGALLGTFEESFAALEARVVDLASRLVIVRQNKILRGDIESDEPGELRGTAARPRPCVVRALNERAKAALQ